MDWYGLATLIDVQEPAARATDEWYGIAMLIGALGGFVTAACAAILSVITAINSMRAKATVAKVQEKVAGVETKVDGVHDIVNSQRAAMLETISKLEKALQESVLKEKEKPSAPTEKPGEHGTA